MINIDSYSVQHGSSIIDQNIEVSITTSIVFILIFFYLSFLLKAFKRVTNVYWMTQNDRAKTTSAC